MAAKLCPRRRRYPKGAWTQAKKIEMKKTLIITRKEVLVRSHKETNIIKRIYGRLQHELIAPIKERVYQLNKDRAAEGTGGKDGA